MQYDSFFNNPKITIISLLQCITLVQLSNCKYCDWVRTPGICRRRDITLLSQSDHYDEQGKRNTVENNHRTRSYRKGERGIWRNLEKSSIQIYRGVSGQLMTNMKR